MWVGSGVGRTVIVGGAKSFIAQLGAGILVLRPFTVLRTRMLIGWVSDQEAADEGPFGSYGKIVVTDTASAIGVTALPDPGVLTGDPDADWFVSQQVMSQITVSGTIGVAQSAPANWTVDSKAMRKVGPQDDIVSMFTEEAGVGGYLTTLGRMLIQLH